MRKSKKMNKKYGKGGSIGTLIGAGVGSFVPGVGTAIGASLGGAAGSLIGGGAKEPEVVVPKTQAAGHLGYKKGGKLKKYRKGGKKKYPYGGIMSPDEAGGKIPIGPGANKYEGPQHEQGGIPVTQTGKPTEEERAVAEVEGGETSQKMGDETFIFSDELTVPGTEMTFAEAHEILVQEEAPEEEIEELKAMQEQVRQQEGGDPEEQRVPEEQGQMQPDVTGGGQRIFAKGGKVKGEKGRFRRNLTGKRLKHGGAVGEKFREDQITAPKGNQKSADIFEQREELRKYQMGGRLPKKQAGGQLDLFSQRATTTKGNVRHPAGRSLYTGSSYNDPSSRFQAGRRFAETRNTRLPSSGGTFSVGTEGARSTRVPKGQQTWRHTAGRIGNRLGRSPLGRLSGRLSKRSVYGTLATSAAVAAAPWLIGDSKQQSSVIQDNVDHVPGAFSQEVGFEEGYPNIIPENNFNPRESVETEEPASSAPAPIVDKKQQSYQRTHQGDKFEEPMDKERVDPTHFRRNSKYFRKESHRKGGKLPKYRTGGVPAPYPGFNPQAKQNRYEDVPQSSPQPATTRSLSSIMTPVGSSGTQKPDMTKYGTPSKGGTSGNLGKAAGIAGFLAPSAANLTMAATAKKPESLGRVTHKPLSTTSPSFAQGRRRLGSGFQSAVAGGANPQAAYAQYTSGTNEMSASEADFRMQREDMNEQLRREAEGQNLQLRAQEQEQEAAFKARRMGLVADAVEQPLGAYLQHKRGMTAAGARISDPDERERFMDQSSGLFGFRKGGKLKKAYRKGGRLNYPKRK